MHIQIGNDRIVVPCSKKSMKFSDNPNDDANINEDLIDTQLAFETTQMATIDPCKMLTKIKDMKREPSATFSAE